MTDIIKIKEGDCPYPVDGDDGTAKGCVKNGHCGCDERENALSETEKTIAKLKRYASCKAEHYQVINCADIRVLLDEIERLESLNETRKELIRRYHAEIT